MPRPIDRGGRPSKFTAANALAIVAEVTAGVPRDDAARAVGIGPSTVYRWLAKGRAGDPRFKAFADALRAADKRTAFGVRLGKIVGRMRPKQVFKAGGF